MIIIYFYKKTHQNPIMGVQMTIITNQNPLHHMIDMQAVVIDSLHTAKMVTKVINNHNTIVIVRHHMHLHTIIYQHQPHSLI